MLMNGGGRIGRGAESQSVETGLSVDDRPNKLNIAFWVISSVGAESVVASHYLRVCACTLAFISPPPPHSKHIAISFSLVLLPPSMRLSFLSQHLSFLPVQLHPSFPPLSLGSIPLFFFTALFLCSYYPPTSNF